MVNTTTVRMTFPLADLSNSSTTTTVIQHSPIFKDSTLTINKYRKTISHVALPNIPWNILPNHDMVKLNITEVENQTIVTFFFDFKLNAEESEKMAAWAANVGANIDISASPPDSPPIPDDLQLVVNLSKLPLE